MTDLKMDSSTERIEMLSIKDLKNGSSCILSFTVFFLIFTILILNGDLWVYTPHF